MQIKQVTIDAVNFKNVGIGNVLDFNPNSLLHLWKDNSRNYIQIGNGYTGAEVGDGFKIGINSPTSTEYHAELRHLEEGPMTFFTNDNERMRILGDNGFIGIGTTTPQVRLDVNGEAAIRTVTQNNSLSRVLVVDNSNGGLIQYRDISSIGAVSICTSGSVTDRLTKWSASNTICNSLIYDNGTNVGISTTSPGAHLDVFNTGNLTGIRAVTSITGSGFVNYGILGSCSSTGSALFNTGVYGTAPSSGSNTIYNIGVSGGQVTSSNYFNIGVSGTVDGSNILNFGGMFSAGNNCSSGPFPINIGIYAHAAEQQHSDVCKPGLAGFFAGNVFATGTIGPSDVALKDNIENVNGALSLITSLQPKQYTFKRGSFPHMQLPSGSHFGLIAQQVDTILPNLVSTVMHPPILDTAGNILMDTISFKTLNYTGLIPLLVAGVNELASIEANRPPIIGNYQPDPQNPLTNNYEIPLNNHNYYFTGQGTNPDSNNIGSSVGIGLNCGDPIPFSKLHVLQSVFNPGFDSSSAAGYFENNSPGNTAAGLWALVNGDALGNLGARFDAIGNGNPKQVAVGAWGYADGAGDLNAGIVGEGYGGDFNYGVYGRADNGSENYAIYGEVDTNGFGTRFAGFFVGDVLATGSITQGSDAKLKHHVKELSGSAALMLLNKLSPKNYQYKTSDFPTMSLPKGNQFGLIAQEVEAVLPELVKDAVTPPKRDKQGKIIHPAVPFKAVNYTGFIPVLIGAVKEQQHTIDSLKEVINERLSYIENRLNGCCGNPHNYKTDPNEQSPIHSQDVELKNLQTIILDQNNPNPFAEKTTIGYTLPDDVTAAEIIFHNAEGKQINRTEIATRGRGEINVYAHDLSSGVYTYTLIADGKIIDTKRMVKK